MQECTVTSNLLKRIEKSEKLSCGLTIVVVVLATAMGNIVGGDLRTALIVDISFFGAFSVFLLLWVLFTRRGYLYPMLWSFLPAVFLRAVLGGGLLWNVGAFVRGDGIEVVWLRWAFYILIYGLALTFGYTEYLGFQSGRHSWTVAIALALSMVGPLAATLLSLEQTRIFALCVAAVIFLFAKACLWWYRRAKIHQDPDHQAMPWNHIIALLLISAAWIVAAVMFILGHAFTRKISYVKETWGYFAADVVLYILVPLWALFLHCGCPNACEPRPLAKDVQQRPYSVVAETEREFSL